MNVAWIQSVKKSGEMCKKKEKRKYTTRFNIIILLPKMSLMLYLAVYTNFLPVLKLLESFHT